MHSPQQLTKSEKSEMLLRSCGTCGSPQIRGTQSTRTPTTPAFNAASWPRVTSAGLLSPRPACPSEPVFRRSMESLSPRGPHACGFVVTPFLYRTAAIWRVPVPQQLPVSDCMRGPFSLCSLPVFALASALSIPDGPSTTTRCTAINLSGTYAHSLPNAYTFKPRCNKSISHQVTRLCFQ